MLTPKFFAFFVAASSGWCTKIVVPFLIRGKKTPHHLAHDVPTKNTNVRESMVTFFVWASKKWCCVRKGQKIYGISMNLGQAPCYSLAGLPPKILVHCQNRPTDTILSIQMLVLGCYLVRLGILVAFFTGLICAV